MIDQLLTTDDRCDRNASHIRNTSYILILLGLSSLLANYENTGQNSRLDALEKQCQQTAQNN